MKQRRSDHIAKLAHTSASAPDPAARAGCRIDPPVSVPKLITAKSAATAAAEPPLDPPGTRPGAAGFCTGPYAEFSFELPMANSSQFVLPRKIAPARRASPPPCRHTGANRSPESLTRTSCACPLCSIRPLSPLVRPPDAAAPRATSASTLVCLCVGSLLRERQVGIQARILRSRFA